MPDLKEAAQTMRRILGCEAVAGGEHEEAVTANMTLPLMESYWELVTVVDQAMAAGHPSVV